MRYVGGHLVLVFNSQVSCNTAQSLYGTKQSRPPHQSFAQVDFNEETLTKFFNKKKRKKEKKKKKKDGWHIVLHRLHNLHNMVFVTLIPPILLKGKPTVDYTCHHRKFLHSEYTSTLWGSQWQCDWVMPGKEGEKERQLFSYWSLGCIVCHLRHFFFPSSWHDDDKRNCVSMWDGKIHSEEWLSGFDSWDGRTKGGPYIDLKIASSNLGQNFSLEGYT